MIQTRKVLASLRSKCGNASRAKSLLKRLDEAKATGMPLKKRRAPKRRG